MASVVRSIQVNVSNFTGGDLEIESSSLGQDSSWMSGMQPASDLTDYASASWGVQTSVKDMAASADVILIGVGDGPIVVTFANDKGDVSTCSVRGNLSVSYTVTQVQTGNKSFSQYNVTLNSTSSFVQSGDDDIEE